jgi:phosphatidylglycerol:prolipoprotein diacylglycerol transferase
MGWRIAHSLDPYLWRISESLGIRWFAIPALAGFLLSFLVLRRAVNRGELRRLSARSLEIYILALIAGVFLGARLFHVFLYQFGSFGLDPQAWIAFWRGGLSTQGGIVGGALATWVFCRRSGIAFYEITDRLAVILALALGFSKIGDFINGTGVGTPYEGPLCVDYSQSEFLSDPPVGCRHPTQLYEAVKDWLVFAVLLTLRRISSLPPGVVSWSFVFAYGLGRFPLMFLREESALLLGWSASSWLSGGMTVLGAAMLARLYGGNP